LILSAFGILSTFLPWFKDPFGQLTYGTVGDGWITLFFFLITVSICFVKDRSTSLKGKWLFFSIIPSVLASLTAIYDLSSAQSFLISPQFGIFILILAGISIPIIGFVLKNK
jgi:hypothetical protein